MAAYDEGRVADARDGGGIYEVLKRFGFDRGTDVSPSEGAGVATLEAQMISLQKTQDEQKTAETVPRGDPDGTGKTQMHMVQMEMDLRELQKEVDDMRAGAETLEALKHGHYHYAEDDGTLEALKQGAGDYELQKRVDEMRAGETQVSAGGSTGSTGTPEGRREGIPSMCDGGNGANMIGTDPAAEDNSVVRELMIDPGGGDNIYAGGGKIFYPEITGKWRRKNPGGGHNAPARGGRIKDPGGGENIDIEGSPTDFEKCVDQLVNNEVPRKVYEVQEIKNHRSTKADAA